jgi:hypothetical protein
MTVYIDDMRRLATVGRVTATWSHLMADTSKELHEFAAKLGVPRAWVQHEGTHREHYDLTEALRQNAIELGAEQISYPRGTARVLRNRRNAS